MSKWYFNLHGNYSLRYLLPSTKQLSEASVLIYDLQLLITEEKNTAEGHEERVAGRKKVQVFRVLIY